MTIAVLSSTSSTSSTTPTGEENKASPRSIAPVVGGRAGPRFRDLTAEEEADFQATLSTYEEFCMEHLRKCDKHLEKHGVEMPMAKRAKPAARAGGIRSEVYMLWKWGKSVSALKLTYKKKLLALGKFESNEGYVAGPSTRAKGARNANNNTPNKAPKKIRTCPVDKKTYLKSADGDDKDVEDIYSINNPDNPIYINALKRTEDVHEKLKKTKIKLLNEGCSLVGTKEDIFTNVNDTGRNLTQKFFKYKTDKCDYCGKQKSREIQLDRAHPNIGGWDRPSLLKKAICFHFIDETTPIKASDILRTYIKKHDNIPLFVLCKKCHRKYDK